MQYCRFVVWDTNVGYPLTWVMAVDYLVDDWQSEWYLTAIPTRQSLLSYEEINKKTYEIIAKAAPQFILSAEYQIHDLEHLEIFKNDNKDILHDIPVKNVAMNPVPFPNILPNKIPDIKPNNGNVKILRYI